MGIKGQGSGVSRGHRSGSWAEYPGSPAGTIEGGDGRLLRLKAWIACSRKSCQRGRATHRSLATSAQPESIPSEKVLAFCKRLVTMLTRRLRNAGKCQHGAKSEAAPSGRRRGTCSCRSSRAGRSCRRRLQDLPTISHLELFRRLVRWSQTTKPLVHRQRTLYRVADMLFGPQRAMHHPFKLQLRRLKPSPALRPLTHLFHGSHSGTVFLGASG